MKVEAASVWRTKQQHLFDVETFNVDGSGVLCGGESGRL